MEQLIQGEESRERNSGFANLSAQTDSLSVQEGKWSICKTAELDAGTVELIVRALDEAEKAKEGSCPGLSGFRVGAALISADGRIFRGANLEYGGGYARAENRSLCAEQVAVGNGLQAMAGHLAITMIAVVSDSETPITPCGNCLDVLQTFGDRSTLIIGGGCGGRVFVWSFEDLMPEGFGVIPEDSLGDKEREALAAAMSARARGFDVLSKDVIGSTGAAILCDNDAIFPGTREDNAAWKPVSAVQSALSHCRIHGEPYVKSLFFVSDDGRLSGLDRLYIFEKANELGREESLEVFIYNATEGRLMKTRPSELLPQGFGTKSLGEELQSKVEANLKRYQ